MPRSGWKGSRCFLMTLDTRPILSVQNLNTTHTEEQGWITDDAYNNPPFYQFDAIGRAKLRQDNRI